MENKNNTTLDDLATSLDELARITKDGFDGVEGRINRLEEEMKGQFQGVNNRVDVMAEQVGTVKHLLDHDVARRLQRLENAVFH